MVLHQLLVLRAWSVCGLFAVTHGSSRLVWALVFARDCPCARYRHGHVVTSSVDRDSDRQAPLAQLSDRRGNIALRRHGVEKQAAEKCAAGKDLHKP